MTTDLAQKHLVVQTKLVAPRLPRRTLPRPRLTQRLLEAADYRLTLVQAGAGYGKSTALAALSQPDQRLAWYHLDSEDADPLRFFFHLWHSLRLVLPALSEEPLAILEASGSTGLPSGRDWNAAVDALCNVLMAETGETLLFVLDDFHQLDNSTTSLRILDRLIGRASDNLHFILAGRYPIRLPGLVNWQARSQVLEVGQEELLFTVAEVTALFRERYGLPLSAEQVGLLAERVEGWPMALPLVWQRLQRQPAVPLARALAQLSGSGSALFTFLGQEVIAQQPADIQAFLRRTAVLRQLTAELCDALRDAHDSEQILHYLVENGLFAIDLGGGTVRYHRLFHDLLCTQLEPEAAAAAHRAAAVFFQAQGELEEAIYHFLAGARLGDKPAYEEAATLIEQLGNGRVRAGHLDTVAAWISALPPEVLYERPPLLICLGDIARLHSRFDEALGWYQQAETRSRTRGDIPGVGQALRGQARIYLDTVNPSQAERLLQEALRLADGQEDREGRARLLELLAENLLNRGRAEEARRYQTQARMLRDEGPDEADLSVRLLLRTGRLDEARTLLEARVQAEAAEPVLRPRAHRETFLLLSLILAMQGERDGAFRHALAGMERGEALQSPFITAVGYMRQGHAYLLDKRQESYAAALDCYHKAIALSEELLVPRLKVEAYWGVCQAHGFAGALAAAEAAAATGVEQATIAGDAWVAAVIRTAMGAGYVLAAVYDRAVEWLAEALTAFRECGDTYGEAVVRLWLGLVWQQTGDKVRCQRDAGDLLALVQNHGYDYLFLRPTLLGPPDLHTLIPLLLVVRDNPLTNTPITDTPIPIQQTAERLLAQLDLDGVQYHPGYQLRVQTLGNFRVWRGAEEVSAADWQRQSARALFQLLLTQRRPLEREEIIEQLWPGQSPEEGQRTFKAAYSSLCRALEPERDRNAPSAYVLRDGSRYGLRAEADMWLDTAEFDRLLKSGDHYWTNGETEEAIRCYRQALALYEGQYLEAYPYEEWCSAERERLLTAYLRAAERLAGLLAEKAAWQEVIATCHLILARDNCWEAAYRLMMTAYAHLGNRTQLLRTYRRCVAALREELGVEPSPATVGLYETSWSER